MADTSSSQLMDQLFSAIYDLVTKEPAPGDQQKLPEGARKGGKFSRSNTAVHIALPGIGLFEDDFRNMWTPGNPTGLKDQTAGFSVLVDSMPAPGSSRYIQSAKRVSQAYQAVLAGANAASSPMSDATRQMLAKIDKFLWEDKAEPRGPFDDPGAPPPAPKRQKTAAYQKFEKLSEDIGEAADNIRKIAALAASKADWQQAYTDAEIDEIVKDPAKKNRIADRALRASEDFWTANAAAPQREYKRLMQEMDGDVNMKYVKQALDFQSTHGNELSGSLLANAKALAKLGDWTPVGSDVPVKLAFPSSTKFADRQNQDGWTQMTVSTTDVHKTEKSLSVKVSVGGGGGFCLWRAKAAGSYEREELHTAVESKSMSATLEISLVNIARPWLDATLFSQHVQWNAGADQDKGTVSSGVVETQNEDHLLPFIPMQMIVARKVRLVADWSKEQRDFVANASSSEVSVGWGPFSVNTSHQHKDSLLDEDTQGRGAGLNFPGIQCLGFVSWVPPFSAPQAGEGGHVKRSVPTVKNPAAIEAVVGNLQLPPGQRKPVLKRAGV